MPYALRDDEGRIVALQRQPPADAPHERADLQDPEVRAFLGQDAGAPESAFEQLDADFVRVIEDVIDVLLARHLIQLTDLPPQAQAKLLRRKDVRGSLGGTRLDLFGEPGSGGADPASHGLI